MKIGGSGNADPLLRSYGVGPSRRGGGSDPANPGADRLELSPIARELQALGQRLREVPVARAELVARLKVAVANGEYRVDAAALADVLMRSGVLAGEADLPE